MALNTLPAGAFADDAITADKINLANNFAFTGTITGASDITKITTVNGAGASEIDFSGNLGSFNLFLNGSQQQLTGQAKQFSPGSNETLRFTATGYINLSVGDYIEAFVSHNEGGSINLRSAESSFGGYRIIGA